jgi:hypothetical protein
MNCTNQSNFLSNLITDQTFRSFASRAKGRRSRRNGAKIELNFHFPLFFFFFFFFLFPCSCLQRSKSNIINQYPASERTGRGKEEEEEEEEEEGRRREEELRLHYKLSAAAAIVTLNRG